MGLSTLDIGYHFAELALVASLEYKEYCIHNTQFEGNFINFIPAPEFVIKPTEMEVNVYCPICKKQMYKTREHILEALKEIKEGE